MTVTNQDIYLLAELFRKDRKTALEIATPSANQAKETTHERR